MWSTSGTTGFAAGAGYYDDAGVTESGLLLKTTDAGLTWKVPARFPASLTRVAFTDAKTGYVTGAKGLLQKTTDSGATWTRLYP